MKKLFGILSIVVILIDVNIIINLLLNKKYVVGELSLITERPRIENNLEIIMNDYNGVVYILGVNILLVLILVIALIKKN